MERLEINLRTSNLEQSGLCGDHKIHVMYGFTLEEAK